MRLTTKLIFIKILASLLLLPCCHAGVVLRDSPRTGKQIDVQVHTTTIMLKRSNNTNIYIYQDSTIIDTIKH